jgi:hypothetical protein
VFEGEDNASPTSIATNSTAPPLAHDSLSLLIRSDAIPHIAASRNRTRRGAIQDHLTQPSSLHGRVLTSPPAADGTHAAAPVLARPRPLSEPVPAAEQKHLQGTSRSTQLFSFFHLISVNFTLSVVIASLRRQGSELRLRLFERRRPPARSRAAVCELPLVRPAVGPSAALLMHANATLRAAVPYHDPPATSALPPPAPLYLHERGRHNQLPAATSSIGYFLNTIPMVCTVNSYLIVFCIAVGACGGASTDCNLLAVHLCPHS